MVLKMIAVAGLASVVLVGPAFAMGGGSRHATGTYSGGRVTGSFDGGTFEGTCNPGGACTGRYVYSASEPLGALAVGLGLLGARLLRRR